MFIYFSEHSPTLISHVRSLCLLHQWLCETRVLDLLPKLNRVNNLFLMGSSEKDADGEYAWSDWTEIPESIRSQVAATLFPRLRTLSLFCYGDVPITILSHCPNLEFLNAWCWFQDVEDSGPLVEWIPRLKGFSVDVEVASDEDIDAFQLDKCSLETLRITYSEYKCRPVGLEKMQGVVHFSKASLRVLHIDLPPVCEFTLRPSIPWSRS